MSASVAFSQVVKRYPGAVEALRDATFTVEAGEFAYVTGHSGAGKSTLFRLIAAIERPTSGTILVNQQNIGRISPRAVPFLRRRLGLILQDPMLLFERTVFDNVMLPLAVTGVDAREAGKRVRAALDKVGLHGREQAKPIALSGGEQQRVAIARAVVHRPNLILADEPTANLDAESADAIVDLFREFHAVGVTILLATHDEALLARHPARRIAMQRGRTV